MKYTEIGYYRLPGIRARQPSEPVAALGGPGASLKGLVRTEEEKALINARIAKYQEQAERQEPLQ